MTPLSITIDGTSVTGIVLIHDKTMLRVAITHPYCELRQTVQVLPRREKAKGGSFTTINPIIKPKDVLTRLYRIGKILHDRMNELIESYYELELQTCRLVADGLVSNRIFVSLFEGYKSLMVQGEMTEKEYNQRMTDLRSKHSQHNERKTILHRDWIRKWFGDGVTDELEGQILTIVRQSRDLSELVEMSAVTG